MCTTGISHLFAARTLSELASLEAASTKLVLLL